MISKRYFGTNFWRNLTRTAASNTIELVIKDAVTNHLTSKNVSNESRVLIGDSLHERPEGTPQGGPLSPLLENVLLDSFDRELEKRGHHFVRYADDCNVYVGSRRAAHRVIGSLSLFLSATHLGYRAFTCSNSPSRTAVVCTRMPGGACPVGYMLVQIHCYSNYQT